MAIWSMGSQTQILIVYLPVPAPLLCKYWTSTFFTVTCIWKKKKKKERESGAGRGIENIYGWVHTFEGKISLLPPFQSLLQAPNPPTNKWLSIRTDAKPPGFIVKIWNDVKMCSKMTEWGCQNILKCSLKYSNIWSVFYCDVNITIVSPSSNPKL